MLEELKEFQTFIEDLRPGKVPYFVKYIDRMKYNIQTYITLGCFECENVCKTLKRDWNEAKKVFLETPGFYIQDEEYEKELTFRFFEYVRDIDSYVKEEKKQF